MFQLGDCVRCLSIYQKHDNVLQYKESKCMMDHMRNYEDLCWSISVDEPLKTLFRVNGKGDNSSYRCTLHLRFSPQWGQGWLVQLLELTPSPTAAARDCAATPCLLSISVQVRAKIET